MEEISGINFRTFAQSQQHLVCRIQLSFSDALDLCKRTKEGSVENIDFRDWFFDKLKDEFEREIKNARPT